MDPRRERVRGIEPPLRAWEARVLPLNYTRRPRVPKSREAPAREGRRVSGSGGREGVLEHPAGADHLGGDGVGVFYEPAEHGVDLVGNVL